MNIAENKVELKGFAGGDVELKNFENDKKLGKVSIAVSERYIGAGGNEVKNTHWFNLVFWNAMADEAEAKIKKGTLFGVSGKLVTNHYEKDGIKRYTTDIVVNEIHLTEKKE